MQIIKSGPLSNTNDSLRFFKEHYEELRKIKYVILYYAEREWLVNRELYHQYVIIVGEKAQLWISGLTWGYYGSGPYGLFTLMQLIDSSITYEEIVGLEWMADDPLMFEDVKGKLVLKKFNESARTLISVEINCLPWEKKKVLHKAHL